MQKQKGFTLIELLVVIAIIAILAAVVLVALGNARRDARNASRRADLNSIMTAIELYATNNGSYPGAGTCGAAGVVATGSSVCGGSAFLDSSTTYIQRLPGNPTPPGGNYGWTSTNNYTLTASLEPSGTFTCSNGSCY
ncbi:MAG: hypothetical protein ACD_63C00026G0001 [uncultured bacterium]|nr:MAG: hypothetical protein ACD_63C00026G0001 [uncultured bacterium]